MKQKVSKVDYSKAMLPRTRRAQFFDCFKMNYALLLKCGLILLLFALPLIAFCLFMDFYYVSLLSHTEEAVEQTLLLFFYFYNLGVVILLLPIVVGASGVIHILRNFIWEEGIFFFKDLGDGIKENAIKNILFSIIFGVLYLLSYFVRSIVVLPIISFFPLALFALIFFPVFLWILFLNNTYSSKFGALFRNGIFFYMKSIGWSILVAFVALALVALVFIPFSFVWLKYIFIVLFFVFILPIIVLIMTLYSISKFDEYINKENYKDFYLKGLNHD